MIVVEPIQITDAQLISSNIVEDTPRSTSATTYNAWSASTTYSAGNIVCREYSFDSSFYETYFPGQSNGSWFATFTSKVNSNLNRDPIKVIGTGSGYNYWTQTAFVPKWSSTTTYAVGAIVGHISGATGALYQCIQAGTNQNPATASTYWRQTTTDSYNSWSGATTYAVGEQVVVLNGTLASVYTSLQNSNLNKTPATETAWWAYEGDTYKQWASGTTYAAGDVIIDLRTHHAYESLQGSNTGKDPTTGANPTWWLDLGATNRWAMFDLSNSSVSSAAEEIDATVMPGTMCDTVALLNMTASQVQVIVTSVTGGGTVYDQTFDMTDPGQITDWRKYFFEPLTYKSDLIVTDLPPYSDMVIRVIATYSGGIAQIGAFITGMAGDLGDTVYGASSGIIDYSRKEADDFGNYTFVERTYSKTGQFRIVVPNTVLDSVFTRLARLRATPVLYRGSGDYASTWIFGFYRNMETVIEHPQNSALNLEIEGLT